MIIRVTGKATEVLKVVKVGALTGADGQEKFVARLNSSPTKIAYELRMKEMFTSSLLVAQ
jgi:hypothetical protein